MLKRIFFVENQARDIVDEVINHVSRRNYIGLADASYLFIAKCEESKKILYALNEESDFAKQFCKYERKLKQGKKKQLMLFLF